MNPTMPILSSMTILTQAEGTLDLAARTELIGKLEMIMQEDGPIVQPLWRKLFISDGQAGEGFLHPPDTLLLLRRVRRRSLIAAIVRHHSSVLPIYREGVF